MQTRTLRPGWRQPLTILLISAVATAAGIWLITQGDIWGWIIAVFFGICTFIYAVLLLPGSTYLRLEPAGFTVCSLFLPSEFAWTDVETFFVKAVKKSRTVAFRLAPDYDGAMATREFAVTISGNEAALPDTYGLTPEQLAELLNQWRRKHAEGGFQGTLHQPD